MRFVLLNKNKWLKPITTVKKKTNVCELMKPHHVHMFLCQVYQSRLLSFNLRDSTHSYPCLMPLFWFIILHRGYGCKNYIQFVCTLLVLHFPHQTWHALSNLQICRLKSNIDSSQTTWRHTAFEGWTHMKDGATYNQRSCRNYWHKEKENEKEKMPGVCCYTIVIILKMHSLTVEQRCPSPSSEILITK